MKRKLLFLTVFTLSVCITLIAQVTFEKEIKISDSGLYFDGEDVPNTSSDNGTATYDFVFGNRITPHGDCIKEYNGYVFMTWYRGGKFDRHVMLSRYNPNTGVVKTIEFPHQHNGFQNQWWLGESHNTIAIGVCPIDGTVHMLYDMHSYDENRPSDGSLANDYFRYTYSKKNAATVPDSEFNINQFVKDSEGDYKHIEMKSGVDYRSLTYPNFFLNKKGELFMWIREGGNNNGAYKFCKYDGNQWSGFTQFNILNAKNKPGMNYNWGLYGDIKFSGGKMRIGFSTRYNDNNDKYTYNNGFHYAYSDDANGLTQWKDHTGKSLSLPVIDPSELKISEPGDQVPSAGGNSVTMSSGSDWITTDDEAIHFVTRVKGSDNKWVNVHTYKKASETTFKTATDFPGGNLYAYKNDVYLIGLEGGRVFVEKAPGGTNNWTRIYKATSGKTFRHGNVYITETGSLYFYLMENKSGSAQPIYLQILDLGLETTAPEVSVTSPVQNAVYELGEEIPLKATASDDGEITKVNFKIDNNFYKTINTAPYEYTFTPTAIGTYKIAARAFDNDNEQTEAYITITVVAPNEAPEIEILAPLDAEVYYLGDNINLSARASDDLAVTKVNFKVNGAYHSQDATGNNGIYSGTFLPTEIGEYTIGARAFDEDREATEVTVTIEVKERLITNFIESNEEIVSVYPNPTSGIIYFNNKYDWELRSISGRIISKGNGSQIDLSGQAKGMYLLKVEEETLPISFQ